MCITSSSIFMAFISSNIVIIFLTIVFRKWERIIRIGFQLIGVFCILTFIRLIFPFELLKISTNIYVPENISNFISIIFFEEHFSIGKISLSLSYILVFIWIVVFFYYLSVYIIAERRHDAFIKMNGNNITEDFYDIINEVCQSKNIRRRIRVYNLSVNISPFVFKFDKFYNILIPDNIFSFLSKKEIEYVIRHEIMHISNYDLEKKKFVNIMCMFYWWNPFCRELKKQTDLLFELRVDEKFSGNLKEKKEYLNCIIKVLEKNNFSDIPSYSIGFSERHQSILSTRFYMLLNKSDKKQSKKSKLTIIPVVLVYILSFLFIVEVSSTDWYTKSTTIDPTNQNTRIIEKNDGTYDVYFQGLFVENTDSLKHYPRLKIYISEKEAFKDYEYEKRR